MTKEDKKLEMQNQEDNQITELSDKDLDNVVGASSSSVMKIAEQNSKSLEKDRKSLKFI